METLKQEYLVLARKYRPRSFKDLKGQETVVKVFDNAFASSRIAHAYLFTGIRGVGKTTTARIIAKALNCVGENNNITVPTTNICNQCMHCIAINEDRHADVLEMDAASKTGIDDVKDIIDFSRYVPVLGRYKVIIIDEVHMLSTKAFNALLKTLEEPPARVVFIFATTEAHKIPITILSRCQKFDLRRLSVNELAEYYMNICQSENITYSESAIRLIAAAAEGSVRDGLSLLDLAISYNIHADAEHVSDEVVQKIIGRNSNTHIINILEALFHGEHQAALKIIRECVNLGTEPNRILESLVEIVYSLTILKTDNILDNKLYFNQAEQERLKTIALEINMPVITRLWSILLKGIEELKLVTQTNMALEMLIIRICYLKSYPTPIDLLENNNAFHNSNKVESNSVNSIQNINNSSLINKKLHESPKNYQELTELFKKNSEIIIYNMLYYNLIPVNFNDNKVDLVLRKGIDSYNIKTLERDISKNLELYTGSKWYITIQKEGEINISEHNTLDEQSREKSVKLLEEVREYEPVKRVLQKFNGSKIISVRNLDGQELLN